MTIDCLDPETLSWEVRSPWGRSPVFLGVYVVGNDPLEGEEAIDQSTYLVSPVSP